MTIKVMRNVLMLIVTCASTVPASVAMAQGTRAGQLSLNAQNEQAEHDVILEKRDAHRDRIRDLVLDFSRKMTDTIPSIIR